MSLTVTPGVGSLHLSWSLPVGAYAALVKWRRHSGGPWLISQPLVTDAQITGLPAVPIDVQVVLLPAGGVLTASQTPLASPPPPAPAPALPKYGISPGYSIFDLSAADQQFELDQDKAVGAGMVRLDCTTANQALLSTVVQQMTLRGLKAMLCLHGTTKPRAVDSFGHDMAAAWQAETNIFEICNEPDLNGWTPDVYADFVKGTAASIRAGNPNAIVIAGALYKGTAINGVTYTSQDYVRSLIARAKGSFDVLSMHLYDDPLTRAPWNIWDVAMPWPGGFFNGTTCRELLDAAGLQTIPIISTESGGPVPKYSEATQATIIANALDQVSAGRIASLCVYTMLDDGVPGFGMLRPDRTQRPSFAAYHAHAV